MLKAYYYHLRGVYETDFPDFPPMKYNFTGEMPRNIQTSFGTRVRVLPFNCTVQVVFQNTKTLFQEGHPLHLHGQNFWVVGMGLGNFNPFKDPIDFNLRNPISRNTVVVPSGGWAAIRFRTLNPGMYRINLSCAFGQCFEKTNSSFDIESQHTLVIVREFNMPIRS